MKLGNVSQTIVQVPKFFMNRRHHPIDTFELNAKTQSNIKFNSKNKKKNLSLKQKMKTELEIESNFSFGQKSKDENKKSRNTNFTDTKILTTYYDININNNPRYKGRYWLNLNKEKFLPNYYSNDINNKTQINETSFPWIIDMNKPKEKNKKNKKYHTYNIINNFYNYKKYKDNANMNKFLSQDLRNEIIGDTKNLIDRINMNYDLNEWNKFDSRTTLNRFFQTGCSPMATVVKNTTDIRDKFINTINQKALGLNTINEQVKKNNIKVFHTENNIDTNNDSENINKEKSFDKLLDKNRSNLLKLKYNNKTKLDYNENDKMFIKENEYITKKLNKTKIYKEFPSKTREEFNCKKIVKYKELFKIDQPIKNLIKIDKYGDNKTYNKHFKKEEKDFYEKMWIRPLHKDAFKLNN